MALLPTYRAFSPDVGQRDDQDAHEYQDLADAEERDPSRAHPVLERARTGQVAVAERPRVEERGLDVEHQEEDRHLVELDLEARPWAADHLGAALVGVVLRLARSLVRQRLRHRGEQDRKAGP